MSAARVVVFALALSHVAGIADLLLDDGCHELCPDDGCGDDCVPGNTCRCHCPSAMPMIGTVLKQDAKLDTLAVRMPELEHHMHPSPDPREILHVPRRVA